ncbi:MAG: alpha/beta hydrolase, partial [Verrucomicrobiota bacterium]|nr:alpha/beta hydrolase [Verrucomicrobiota bacterium]
MPVTAINGFELYWNLSGETGDPLVLLHGSWGDHSEWEQIVPALARLFRVLTYDRRGHSRSERPAAQGSLREDAADLCALLEHLGLGPAHMLQIFQGAGARRGRVAGKGADGERGA